MFPCLLKIRKRSSSQDNALYKGQCGSSQWTNFMKNRQQSTAQETLHYAYGDKMQVLGKFVAPRFTL